MPKKPKQKTLPGKYERGFLAKLDGRSEIAQRLRDNYEAISDDLGGVTELSHVKAALVERFVFLEAVLSKIEADMANHPAETQELLGRWIQAVNSLTGLSKVLGLDRRSKNVWNALTVSPTTAPAPTPQKPKPIWPGKTVADGTGAH
jgi:hypothetical protein